MWRGGCDDASVGVRGCDNDCPRLSEFELYIESLRGGTGGGRSWSVRGGTTGGSGETDLMNTSLLLDIESLLFVCLLRGGRGGGCNCISDSGSKLIKSAV